ncbi:MULTISPECIES: alpha/beta hydrolase [unclassified Nocardioides]|uniref:alpha/beta hydrolase n=1 Tax=unclassified Nocardioides TaxID=2615069 RepID=UPI0006F3F917|nr:MULTISPECIES: alpha/beta hydrolase [unclassified Nocardioides]KRA37212.1 alpha/beta hydrolase [Nocardioides sp. Root614]KRA91173.1 alpha/beta hydrolase [Nocardioides sp. Root682]
MGFVRRQAITAALTANAIRPLPGFRAGIPAFFAGWITGELAPHVLGLTVADAAAHAVGPRRNLLGLALAGVSSAGLAYLIRQSRQAVTEAEDALLEGLGVDYVEQLDAKPSPADLATPWGRVANPFAFGRAARKAGIEVHRDIRFAPHGGRGLLDVYTSEVTPASGAPVLLQVHGGAWTIGKKDQQGLPLMQHLAARGWVCVAINYRLAPRDPWPAQIIDVKAAIAWIRENIEEYGGDPDYIAITGGSAGGHLTALAAVTPNAPEFQPGFEAADTAVQAAVPYYGVYDLAASTGLRSAELMRERFLGPRVFKKRFSQASDVFEQASPLLRVTADAPDFFVIHGAQDTLVDVRQARAFVEALRTTSKRTVSYAELAGTQHAFDIFPSIRSQHLVRATERFLNWHWNQWRREHAAPLSTGAGDPVASSSRTT